MPTTLGHESVFISAIPRYEGPVKTLVVLCSQHNIQEQCDDFLRNNLKKDSYYPIAVPGGSQFFLQPSFLPPKYHWAGTHWADFLITHAHLEEVILIAHEECAWYRNLYGARGNLMNVVMSDLKKMVPIVRSGADNDSINVHLYYARANEQNLIEFLKIG